MRPAFSFLIAIIFFAVNASEASGQTVDERVQVRFGDDFHWAEPALDDAAWEERRLFSPPDMQGVFWIRTHASIASEAETLSVKGLYFSALAASEVYWDGVLIGRSGIVGANRAEESPGPIDPVFLIPDSLYAPGEHTIALRLSTFHRSPSVRNYIYGLEIGDYNDLMSDIHSPAQLPLFFLGGFFIIALYYAALFVLDRRPALLLFSLLCFSVSALLVVESWRWAVGYTYEWHHSRLLLVAGLTFAIGMLLPLFFMVQFRFPFRRSVLGLMLILLSLSCLAPGYDGKSFDMFWSMLLVSLTITVWAFHRKEKGAALGLSGVLICVAALIVFRHGFMGAYFFPAFGGLVVCMLSSLGLQAREQRRTHEKALVNAARLEIELLKKHLQPHFLLNTLTSAMAWLEEHPQTGVRFVEALAEELQMLAEVSGERLIPMARELDLCRTHLELLGYRRDVKFCLETKNVREDALVPPALFHTLVENGITHNECDGGGVTLFLREDRLKTGRRYTFITPWDGSTSPEFEEGTGLRYVKARLEESFPERWSLSSEPSENRWCTTIEIAD
jgi:hypothetical protein